MANKKINITVTLYYANWCGHCKNMAPEWKKIKSELANDLGDINTNICATVENFELKKYPELFQQLNIIGYPTIKIKHDDTIIEYNGIRTKEKIIDFILSKFELYSVQSYYII
jgi:thiol-disulfide isomerase/thioredoxin